MSIFAKLIKMDKFFMFKKEFYFIFFLLVTFTLFSQQYEVGLMMGGSKYIGDIGKEDYFDVSQTGASLILKNTINPWMLMRIGISYIPLSGNDLESESVGRQMRAWNFTNKVFELNMGVEYNFFPRNPYLRDRKYNPIVPYMFTGFTLSGYQGHLNFPTGNSFKYNGTSMGIPMILGFKYKISSHWLFSGEAGMRYNFSDNLDGTENYTIHYTDTKIAMSTGNSQSNDWYSFTSIGLIYTFGDLRCYYGF